MQCDEIEIYLSGYLDQELPQQRRQAVKIHLEDCSRCREILQQLENVKESTEKLRFETPTGEEWTHLQNHILGRVSRRFGWLILGVWTIATLLYSLYWFVASDDSTWSKVLVFGLILGVVLLFFSVLAERIRESQTDRYRGVHK